MEKGKQMRTLMAMSVLLFFGQVHAQKHNIDSLERTYQQALLHVSSPKLGERKRLLRSFQQKGYVSALGEILRGDGFTALASYLRTRLQIEYSISHELVMVDVSAVPGLPIWYGFDINWEFPKDPWKRE